MSTKRSHGERRKAVAGILAALILFVMLFTVGTGYFLFINQGNLLYTQALSARSNGIQSTLSESLLLSPNLNSNSHITIALTNNGPAATTVVGIFVVSPLGTTQYITSGATPPLPYPLNPGVTSSLIDTGVSYSSGTYGIKVLTQRGATFLATYPPTATSLAAQALSSGAIGDLYMSFSGYKEWSITTTGCSSAGDFSGFCLTNPVSAFQVPANFQCYTGTYCNVFSVRVTDLNPNQNAIQLDQFTLLYQLYKAGSNGKAGYFPWFAISNSSNNIYKHFHVINLTYNQPQTIIFGSAYCVQANSGPNLSVCNQLIAGTGWLQAQGSNCGSVEPCGQVGVTFINANGWEQATIQPTNSLSYSTVNYSQNLPFVSTLYQ